MKNNLKKLDSVKGVKELNKNELYTISGGNFPWEALKEIIDWIKDKLNPTYPNY